MEEMNAMNGQTPSSPGTPEVPMTDAIPAPDIQKPEETPVQTPSVIAPDACPLVCRYTPGTASQETDDAGVLAHFRRHWKLYTFVLLIYTAVYAFIFRGIITAIPAILRGDSVINTDELVPFFDWHSQFLDQIKGAFSDLTNGYEFRLRYSVITTWMRHYKLLPFAIVLSNIVGTYAAFVAVSLFLRKIVSKKIAESSLIRGSALAALLINLLLVYSKIIHFYTLIWGANQFLIALLLLFCGMFFCEKKSYLYLAAASILAVATPAIHFVMLYLFVAAFLCIAALVWRFFSKNSIDQQQTWCTHASVKRVLLTMLMTFVCVLLPYALFVKYFVLFGITDLTDTVPVNYTIIETSSLTLLQQISFDIGSVTDNFLLGRYTIPFSRPSKIFFFLLTLLPLLPSARKRIFAERGTFSMYLMLLTLFFFSMWCGIGYPKSAFPTFHVLLAWLANLLYSLHTRITDLLLTLIATFIHILRFPHRFQFITFALATVLMPLGVVTIEAQLHDLIGKWKPLLLRKWASASVGTVVVALFFIPLFCNWEFRTILLSGDFLGFLSPYPTTALREVRDALDKLPAGKTIVLPPSETQKRIEDSVGTRHKFIDKFYIYFLNKPSYYYGLTGDIENKRQFWLFFIALDSNRHWWVNILRDLNVRYVIINKEIRPNGLPSVNEYLKNAENVLREQVLSMPSFFAKRFENNGFALYEFIDPALPKREKLFLNLDWQSYACLQENNLHLTKKYDLLTPTSEEISPKEKITIVTNDRGKSLMDLFALQHADQFMRPDDSSFAFNKDHVPSSRYFGIIYAMLTIMKPSKYNLLSIIMPGVFDTLTGSFVGLPKATTIRFPVDTPQDGNYVVYLRGIFTKNTLQAEWQDAKPLSRIIDEKDVRTLYANADTIAGGSPVYVNPVKYSQKELESLIPQKILPVSNQFSYVRLGVIKSSRGKDWLYLVKTDNNPMVIEGALFVNTSQERQMLTPQSNYTFLTPDQFSP